MADPLDWIDDESAAWADRGLKRSLRPAGGSSSTSRRMITSASRATTASSPRAIEAASRYGWGAGASPLVSGWSDEHEALAREIATFERTEAAVLFPTGYAANLGTIAALVGKPDVIYSDRLNHACLIDGARLSGATIRVYPHNDIRGPRRPARTRPRPIPPHA